MLGTESSMFVVLSCQKAHTLTNTFHQLDFTVGHGGRTDFQIKSNKVFYVLFIIRIWREEKYLVLTVNL